MISSFLSDPLTNYSILFIFRHHIPIEINLTFGDSHANEPVHWGNGLAVSKSGVIQNK